MAKKAVPESVQKAAAKLAENKINNMAKMAGTSPTVIKEFILALEAEDKVVGESGKRKREINAKIKANGYNLGAVADVRRLRKMSPDVMLNRIEDTRQIIMALDDMAHLDIYGIKAIQKYVDEHKAELAPATTPEAGAKSLMGHNSKAAGGIAAANDAEPASEGIAPPTPRRVSEIVTH